MINPAIETDLVGDVIEVYTTERWVGDTPGDVVRVRARGLCRAVTAGPQGALVLWLEVREEDLSVMVGSTASKGDILLDQIDYGGMHGSSFRMRLIRS